VSTGAAAAGSTIHVPDRDARAADVGMWLFLASLVMFYGALFSGYVLLRAGSTAWDTPWLTVTAPWRILPFAWSQSLWLAGVGASVWRWRVGSPRHTGQPRAIVGWLPVLASVTFTADWVNMARAVTAAGHGAATSVGAACWFVLTGTVAVGVIGGGMVVAGTAWRSRGATPPPHRLRLLQRYWMIILAFWLSIVTGCYLV
jgi:heme/copper-type cytochrome/quinol oxidase subunit 3